MVIKPVLDVGILKDPATDSNDNQVVMSMPLVVFHR